MKHIGHNHVTRDIKPRGQCPACDRYHEFEEEEPDDDRHEELVLEELDEGKQ